MHTAWYPAILGLEHFYDYLYNDVRGSNYVPHIFEDNFTGTGVISVIHRSPLDSRH